MKTKKNFYTYIVNLCSSKICIFCSLIALNLFSVFYIVMFRYDFLYRVVPFLAIVFFMIIWIIFNLTKKNDEFKDLNHLDDHDSISRNLYYSLIFCIKNNNINEVLKMCTTDVLLKIDLNGLITPSYIHNKVMSKTQKFAEYSFVCFENQSKIRRFQLKLGLKENGYIICGLEDEK